MEDDELNDELDQDEEETPESGSDSAPPAAGAESGDSGKRINDLMSKWQKAESERNRLAAEVTALKSGKPAEAGAQGSPVDGRVSEFEEFARENARNLLFNSDPRLAQMGLAASDISGDSLKDMKASLAKQQKLIDGMEGQMRNRILAEHGLSPEVSTGAGDQTPSFSTMSDEEFDKFLASRGGLFGSST